MQETLQILEVGGRRIACLHAQPENTTATVLWLPGFMSDMGSQKACTIIGWAHDWGIGTLRFDYSGHGVSPGNVAEGAIGDWLDEAEAVARLARGPLVIGGSSMGGWIALLLLKRMAERGDPQPLGCVLVAPAWDMTEALMWDKATDSQRAALLRDGVFYQPSDYSDAPYPIGRRLIEEGRNHLLAGKPFGSRCPVFILQGMEDTDVPWERTLALSHLVPNNFTRFINDGDHRLSRPEDLVELIHAFSSIIADVHPELDAAMEQASR